MNKTSFFKTAFLSLIICKGNTVNTFRVHNTWQPDKASLCGIIILKCAIYTYFLRVFVCFT